MKLKLDQNLRDMFNYLIKIEYDGSKFVGWQYQKNGKFIMSDHNHITTETAKGLGVPLFEFLQKHNFLKN